MGAIPSNVSHLDPFLQHLNRSNITLREEEIREANLNLQKVLLHTMLNEMKRVDETFREVYQQPHYVGSYYENLRVGHPSEFDINLELQLPISESHIEIQTTGTEHGFAKIKVNAQFQTRASEAVKRKIESWLEDGYLCRDKIIQWLQGIVDKVLKTVRWPQNIKVMRNMSGPAVTLNVQENTKQFAVDLVPVFCFGTNRWPPRPTRQLSSLPWQFSPNLKWCVVPKSPRRDSPTQNSVFRYQWRMSFYMHEREMMNNLNNMKPVIKFMKLLRDKQNWPNLSSYYIKTLFMLEQVIHDPGTGVWRKGLGYLFMHMLGRLEEYLQVKKIPFFWDERCNLISHLGPAEIQNILDRVKYLKRQLELALSQPDKDISSVMGMLFPLEKKAKELIYFEVREVQQAESTDRAAIVGRTAKRSNEPFVPEEREVQQAVQQAESTGWTTAILGGIAAGLGALFLVDRALSQNRDNQ